MTWLETQPHGVLKDWLRRTQSPMLATLPNGEILWVNPAFEALLGYSSPEIIGRLTWKELTADASDLQADVQLALQAVAGERKSYMLQKPYRTKAGPAKNVIIDVLRYPSDGDFQCFLVTALPTDRGIEFAMGQLADLRELILQLANRERSDTWKAFERFAAAHPIWVTIIGLLFATLLFGERVIEICKLLVGLPLT